MKRHLIMVALAAAVAAPSAFAVTDAQLKAIKRSLSAVPAPELPAKAAEIVTQAPKEDRETVAVTVVRAAIYKSRSSAPVVVAAVSKAAPDVAAPVSRVAAELEAGQSESIAAAATGAAPAAKSRIVASVQQGVYGPSLAASSHNVTTAQASSSISTATSIAPSAAAAPFTARGGAKTEHGGEVHHKPTPINENHSNHGNGDHDDPDHDHGRFPHSPPHGGHPPGHDDDHHGRPPFCDYTKPRHY